MIRNISVFTSDIYWQHIFVELGAVIADSRKVADVVFDDLDIKTPVAIKDLYKIILDAANNTDIITDVFGKYVILPTLQHKIVVLLYKNPNITMQELKNCLGLLPDITTHTVENAIYQLRKIYGHDFIQNINGTYKIGHV